MKVLLLSRYGPLGPSSRVRFYQYLPYLKAQGVELQTAPLLNDGYVQDLYSGKLTSPLLIIAAYAGRILRLARSGSFDLLWIEKELFPWLPPWAELFLARQRIPYVVDYDDAVFHRYDLHSNPVIRKILGRSIDTIMRNSSITVAGNDYLAARARTAGARRVEYLPSVIDLDRYTPLARNAHPDLRVGWIGSPVTAPYLNLVYPALREVAQKTSLRLVVVGARAPASFSAFPVEFHQWDESTEVDNIRSFDVGIMPLPDEPFERGKCGYKLIQYMGCGIPVVASPVGANSQIVEHGRTGFLASSHAEWANALLALHGNPPGRIEMGKAGRQKAEQKYSLQTAAPRLFEILQRAGSIKS